MNIKDVFDNVLVRNREFEFKAKLSIKDPVKWAKTIVGYANTEGGIIFIGVSNNGEVFGLDLKEIDETKSLVSRVNDRYIFPHVKYSFMMRSIDERAEKFVLALKVLPSDSIVRYREGDFNEKVFIKGDANSTPATPEEIISLSKRKYGVDNETTDTLYDEKDWTSYINLCKEFRLDSKIPTLRELQNEQIVSKDGYAKSGFLMFKDDYTDDDSLICCRVWKTSKK